MKPVLAERISAALVYATISRRMNLFRHRALSLLAIAAVATSAALAVSVEVASRSVGAELTRTATALVGSADLEVVSTRRGVAEDLVDVVRAVPGVAGASPMIGETVRIATTSPAGIPLYILGVDLLGEQRTYDLQVQRRNVTVRDPLLLLARSESFIITSTLANRLGLDIGSRLTVRSNTGSHTLVVAGIITGGDLRHAYGGRIAVMDVWALQKLVGSEGFVDRIDVMTDGERRTDVMERIQSAVGSRADVRPATHSEGAIEAILGVLNGLLWGVPVFGVVLGSLLSYAAISQLVRSRVRRLALMHCVGVSSHGMFALVLADSVVLSAIGAVLGLVGGAPLAPVIVRGFSRLSEHIGQLGIESRPMEMRSVLVTIAVWLSVAFSAAMVPAWRVARSSPLAALSDAAAQAAPAPLRRRVLVHGVVAVLFVIVLAVCPRSVPALPRLVAIVLAGFFALISSGPEGLRWLVRALRPLLARVPRVGNLVGLSILAHSASAAISMVTIAAIMGFIVVLLTVVESTVASIDAWLAARSTSSATIFAGAPNAGFGGEPIMAHVIEEIRSTPGVDDLAILFTTRLAVQGHETTIQALSTDVSLRRDAFYRGDTPPKELAQALLRGEVAMTYAFSRYYSKSIGDSIVLPTREGERAFRIGGVVRNYAGPSGTLLMDVATFDRYFARDGATLVQVWSRLPTPVLQKAIEERVGAVQPLFFRYGEEERGIAARNLQRFRSLFYLVIGVAALFCGAALVNVAAAGITSRRRELAVMETVGATPSNISASVVLDAMMLSIAGIAAGVFLGILTGKVLSELFFERLGWLIDYRVSPYTIVEPAGALLAACALIGLVPAFGSKRPDPVAVIKVG